MFLRIDYSNKVIQGNYLLHASARQHSVRDFAGPLSVKTVLSGEVSWQVGGRSLTVRQGEMLVLNHGQTYSLNIDEPSPVETRVAFFAPGWVESACRGIDLDEPFASAVPGFHSRVMPLNAPLRSALDAGDFVRLAQELAREHGYWARIPALKPATRDELLARLHLGRDFLHASAAAGPVSLRDAARVACLSEFHFHRVFRQVFRDTPHSYVRNVRLEAARRRISASDEGLLEIALATGFAKPGDLSMAFRQKYGVTPSEYRRRIRKISVEASPVEGVLFTA